MTRKHHLRTTAALVIGLGAVAPAAASARPIVGDPVTHVSQVGPPILQSATASQQPEVHRLQTAASHAFAYKPPASARYSTAGLNGSVGSPTIGGPAIVRVIAPRSGFDWGDAGIGAAGGLALSMLGIGGALVISSQRRTRRPASPPAPIT